MVGVTGDERGLLIPVSQILYVRISDALVEFILSNGRIESFDPADEMQFVTEYVQFLG